MPGALGLVKARLAEWRRFVEELRSLLFGARIVLVSLHICV